MVRIRDTNRTRIGLGLKKVGSDRIGSELRKSRIGSDPNMRSDIIYEHN